MKKNIIKNKVEMDVGTRFHLIYIINTGLVNLFFHLFFRQNFNLILVWNSLHTIVRLQQY